MAASTPQFGHGGARGGHGSASSTYRPGRWRGGGAQVVLVADRGTEKILGAGRGKQGHRPWGEGNPRCVALLSCVTQSLLPTGSTTVAPQLTSPVEICTLTKEVAVGLVRLDRGKENGQRVTMQAEADIRSSASSAPLKRPKRPSG
jgi:hypothetical protein